jgi:hypothetical protein
MSSEIVPRVIPRLTVAAGAVADVLGWYADRYVVVPCTLAAAAGSPFDGGQGHGQRQQSARASLANRSELNKVPVARIVFIADLLTLNRFPRARPNTLRPWRRVVTAKQSGA